MTRGNVVIVNVAGGELSPDMYSRLDLPIYQRGNQRVQNFIVKSQGGLDYRNGLQHCHNTRGLQSGRLITFTFSEFDTYVIEMTEGKLRFYRNFGAILNDATKAITAITKANPGVVTSVAHGLVNGQEIFISGIVGMKELNGQFFTVANVTTDTFTLKTIAGDAINTTNFLDYTSGGTIATVYEIDSPYKLEHIPDLHFKQSADTITFTHQKYAPFRLSRTAHTNWTIKTFERIDDPFKQRKITGITKASPGVFNTTSVPHDFAVGDEVFFADIVGMTEFNYKRYIVDTVPTIYTFTVKDPLTNTPVDTTGYNTWVSDGIVIRTKYCPKTLAYLDNLRICYGNWQENPSALAFSCAPNSDTGATQFDKFTVGANATDAMLYVLSTVFDKVDAIQWIATVNRQLVVGTISSIRRIHGDNIEDPIAPGKMNSKPINSIGSASIQPYSSGQSLFYVDGSFRRLHTFLFSFQANDFVTVNQNLTSPHLGASQMIAIAQQRGDAGLLWVLRKDGVLLGMTFNELESIFGWHRHYIGGKSIIDGVGYNRAKVLSVATEPRLNEESVLWAIVERTVNGKTYRSVEYLNQPVRFLEYEDFLSDPEEENHSADMELYYAATGEQLKDSIHLDGAVTYDGSALSTSVTMTPSAATGNAITITASGAFFDATMVGREIWKAHDSRGQGGGRASIEAYVSPTQVTARVLVDFNNTSSIPVGSWYLTTDKVYGLLHRVGETVDLQLDGAPGPSLVVASDGSVSLPAQTSKVHIGNSYRAISTTMNLDVAGPRGSSEARIRKMNQIIARFFNTVGGKIGTSLWNVQPIIFKTLEDITDRATRLFQGVAEIRPHDSYSRQTKQVVVIQDIPSPMNLSSLDVEVEAAVD